MHCCLCDALFNSADNQIQLVQRFAREVALSALERSSWVSQNTCYSVKRHLWLGHIHCWASKFRKKADKVVIHHLILCDFEDIYTGREGNKWMEATTATVMCFYIYKGVVPGNAATLTPSVFLLISCFLPLLTAKFVQSSALTHSVLRKNNTSFYLVLCNGL